MPIGNHMKPPSVSFRECSLYTTLSRLTGHHDIYLHSTKLRAKASGNRPQKGNLTRKESNHPFSGVYKIAVSFREGSNYQPFSAQPKKNSHLTASMFQRSLWTIGSVFTGRVVVTTGSAAYLIEFFTVNAPSHRKKGETSEKTRKCKLKWWSCSMVVKIFWKISMNIVREIIFLAIDNNDQ